MRHRTLATFLTLAATIGLTLSARAETPGPVLTVLYSFTNELTPVGGVALGTNHGLFGVTATGGPGNHGGVYGVATNGPVTITWFNGNNGSTPLCSLITDASDNLYGTTSSGSVQSNGTVFEFTHNGLLQTLAYFDNTNGSTPMGPLLRGTNGFYYGTAFNGGSNNSGAIFMLNGNVLSNVYSFTGGSNGANPASGLVQGPNGNLYGTTANGGSDGLGTVFESTYNGALTNLGSFAIANGAFPGGLVAAAGGVFYGAASNGGANHAGTIFELNSRSNLETFTTFGLTNGAIPNSPLIVGDHGFLYGTTEEGGAYGMGTIFCLSPRGMPIIIYSFRGGTHGAYPNSGVMEETNNETFYGTTSGGGTNGDGVIYELAGIPPFIVTPPAPAKWAAKGKAGFSVAAGGAPPLFYQWQFISASATNNIPGATNFTLTVTNEQVANSGIYSVLVTNSFGAASAGASLSVTEPTAAIQSPAAGARTNRLIVKGTASAQGDVYLVNYWITNVNAGMNPPVTVTTGVANLITNGTTSSWSVSNATPLPGTNYFTAQSVDSLGNPSALVTREFFYVVSNRFALVTNGPGGVSGSAAFAGARPTNGAMLNVGEGYTLTAKPSNFYVFSNWTSSTGFTSNDSTLHFIMESNLTITATFTTNLFRGAAETYNGLFSLTNEVTEQTAGMLENLTVRSNGAYSGTLQLGGGGYGFSGTFDLSGYASNAVNRKVAAGGSLSLEMNLGWTNGEITGIVSGANGGAWVSVLNAEKAVSSPSAEYTVLLSPATNPMGKIPPGSGYLLVTNHLGNVKLTGTLADGSTFSQTVPMGASGVPVFNDNLYSNKGLLWGWLSFSNGSLTAETNLTWIKPAVHSGIYTNGFTNDLSVTGAVWTNPPAGFLLSAALAISNLDFSVSITNKTLAKETGSPTNSLKGAFNPATGLLTIVFGNGNGKATTTGHAALVRDSAAGGGYFVTKTNAGAITITP